MKMNIFHILALGILLLTACGGTSPIDIHVSSTAATKMTITPDVTSLPLPSRTPRERPNEPTVTPLPPTPLPTIPTFTPTFDISSMVTVMPAAKAECPKENSTATAAFGTPDEHGSYEMHKPSEILDFLNAGGHWDSKWGQSIDLTGDGLNEVVFKSLFAYDVFGYKDGQYEDLLEFTGDFAVYLEGTPDLNKNGIPEIILFNVVHYGYVDVSIFEWDGSRFRSLIDMGRDRPSDPPIDWVAFNNEDYKLIDTNQDGLKEIVITHDIHQQARGVLGGYDIALQRPLRNQTIILGWNGKNFVNIKQGTNAPPEYRFQAVQDGDERVHYGNYTTALSFYQAAIFDDRLEWWSSERREYELLVLGSQYEPTPTIFPTPIPDNTEYPRLAAYAYYRIMLLHFAQGHASDAGTVYKTLEQKFSNNQYGRPYYEMANTFWDAYQSTHKMYDGCAAAIQYATNHPAILVPLGSDYHGGYSHTYIPADVCPFR